jgi:hypothetical protein
VIAKQLFGSLRRVDHLSPGVEDSLGNISRLHLKMMMTITTEYYRDTNAS